LIDVKLIAEEISSVWPEDSLILFQFYYRSLHKQASLFTPSERSELASVYFVADEQNAMPPIWQVCNLRPKCAFESDFHKYNKTLAKSTQTIPQNLYHSKSNPHKKATCPYIPSNITTQQNQTNTPYTFNPTKTTIPYHAEQSKPQCPVTPNKANHNTLSRRAESRRDSTSITC
jgi:hypothetical protein